MRSLLRIKYECCCLFCCCFCVSECYVFHRLTHSRLGIQRDSAVCIWKRLVVVIIVIGTALLFSRRFICLSRAHGLTLHRTHSTINEMIMIGPRHLHSEFFFADLFIIIVTTSELVDLLEWIERACIWITIKQLNMGGTLAHTQTVSYRNFIKM